MKNLLITIALLMLSSQVQAADKPAWLYPALKVKNPNELAVWVGAGTQCPVTTDELKEAASGVLIRARVKPLVGEELYVNNLYLSANISCYKIPDDIPAFVIRVTFGNFSVTPPIQYAHSYGSIGLGPKDFIVSAFKRHVEEAITDYIAANFDL